MKKNGTTMAEIITTLFKTDLARNFYTDTQTNEYYIFASAISAAYNDRTDAENTLRSKNLFLDKLIYGKKILPTDVKFMIKYNPWQVGGTFDRYDDNVDIESDKFWCVVGPQLNDTGDYRVYKCLDNNNGGTVSTQPNFLATMQDQIYRTADGYIWKYMFKLTQPEFEAYNASGYIPIVGYEFPINLFEEHPQNANTVNVLSTTTGSPIDQIFVTNAEANAGYPKASGLIAALPGNDQTITLQRGVEYPLNEITNYYNGMTLSIVSAAGVTSLYSVVGYTFNTTTQIGTVTIAAGEVFDNDIEIGNAYERLPTVKLTGDGTGAEAKAVVDDGIVTDVLVIAPGSGYKTVTTTVVDPAYDFDPEDALSTDIRATVRSILSPPAGHNVNPVEELQCRHILMYGYITETDNLQIGATNDYSHVGIVKNPEWANTSSDYTPPSIFDNRIAIVTNDYAKAIVDDTLSQVDVNNDVIFEAMVHEVDTTANTVYLYDYNRTFQNQANSTIALDYTRDLQTSAGQIIQINSPAADNVTESPYTQSSGHVYFIEDFSPIVRTVQSREEYKLVVEF